MGKRKPQSRSDWDEHRRQVRVTNRLRYAAVQELIAEHPDEWAQHYRVQCALVSDEYGIEVSPQGEEAMPLHEAIEWQIGWLQHMLKDPVDRRIEELHNLIGESLAELAVLEAGS